MTPKITHEDAFLIVKKIINEVNGTPIKNINSDDSLIIDLAMDSVELIDFIIRLEEFNVTIQESNISNALTVGDITAFLLRK
ncbi:acyl carrier protein [uncultured Cedecea sp.]|uniref:acyl carrier protein n=1 Tax=uncultured Cedecea sp. TaxID=988762 RepID=UPI002638C91E|nr:phosphopantetheine-binding protein [uncultured Cedecea sp.]